MGAASEGQSTDRFRILCVCTGNVYRSRIAEDELRRGVRARLGRRADRFVITSAGTRATSGVRLAPDYLQALEQLELDTGGLGPTRHLEADDIRAADLVLGAHSEHRAVVLELVPGAMRRTFVLGELARVAAAAAELGAVSEPSVAGDPVTRARLVVAAAARHRGSVPVRRDDDVADPWGQSGAVLELAAGQVREAVGRVLDALVGDLSSRHGRQ